MLKQYYGVFKQTYNRSLKTIENINGYNEICEIFAILYSYMVIRRTIITYIYLYDFCVNYNINYYCKRELTKSQL